MNRNERRLAAKKVKVTRDADPAEKLALAIRLHQENCLERAEKIYRQILKKQPENTDALHFYGVLQHQTGQSEQAIGSIRRALKNNPFYSDAWNNLGNIYKETGDMQNAAKAYRSVISRVPEHVGALNNLGVVLKNLEQYEESVNVLLSAAELSPSNSDIFQNLGNAYQDQGEYSKAIDAYRHSIALNPTQKFAHNSLWRVLRITGQNEAVGEVLEQWLAADPDNPIAKHHLSAYRGNKIPARASDAYIQETFDSFAASFDDVLNKLNYRAPELVAEAVAVLYPEPSQRLCVLDAGCGTGLCGPLLKPYVERLIGVDLSAGMLNKARGRALYDELVEADLVNYLNTSPAHFDLIVSADTLVYFGDLQPFLLAAYKALKPPGHLVFTLEKCEEDADNGFKLNYHGRYSHTDEYVKDLLAFSGFAMRSCESVVLRKESGQPVTGMLVAAGIK